MAPGLLAHPPGLPIRLAVLGDSIGAGQGASRPADTLRQRLVAGLAEHGIETTADVCAAPGARSSGLPLQVDRALRWEPDVAVIVIGANDLTDRAPPEQAAHALGVAVRRLRAGAFEVVVAPAPDLSTMPHVPVAGLLTLTRPRRAPSPPIPPCSPPTGSIPPAPGTPSSPPQCCSRCSRLQ